MSIYVENFKKTKIIATIGPASSEKIEKLLEAGVNGIRLNFSHGTHAEHKRYLESARQAAKKLDRNVSIIQDLNGPKIQLGTLPTGGLSLEAGQVLKLKKGSKMAEDGIVPIQYNIAAEVQKGHFLFLRDGQIRTVVESVRGEVVVVRVLNSGKVLSNQGVNLPDTHFKSSVLTKKDRADLEFAYNEDVDYVAMSFVQSAHDVKELRNLLEANKSAAKIIVKFETKVATHHIEDIVKAADAVMVARGDLAVETSPELVPIIGREIITLCRRHKKVVIMATQMLESMQSSLQPSRAEVSDIASAVTLGVDCVMLSGETAIGNYPVETVQMMKKVILATEGSLLNARSEIDIMPEGGQSDTRKASTSLLRRGRRLFNSQIDPGKITNGDAQISVSLAAITLAEQLGAKIIIAETLTGSTASSIASLRPTMPIIIASPDQKTCNQTALLWGGKPFLIKRREDVAKVVMSKLKQRKSLNIGDMMVAAYGHHRGVMGGTDTIRLIEVQ